MEGGLAVTIEQLLETDRSRLSSAELLAEIRSVETLRRQLEAVTNLQVAEVDQRGVAQENACTSTADLLTQLLLISPREAKLRVARAEDLGPRRNFSGEPLAPIYPHVADALAAGALNSGHVAVIVKTLDEVPSHVGCDVDRAEQFLVGHSATLNPKQLGVVATRLLATVDPDGAEPRDDEQQRRRGFTLRDQPDGASLPTGYLTPECTAALRTVLDPLSKPVPSDDGVGDNRSAAQRRHDAVLEAAQRLIRSGTLPDSGGVPATIVVSMTDQQLQNRTGVAMTEYDTVLEMPTALLLADQADIYTVRLDCHGAILDYGCTRRLASPAQRRALVARDKGCTFPGCTRPASWCQANHAVPWYLGGKTDLNNLHLLCAFHHREYERRGWQVYIRHGIVEWIPPAWLDNTQTPRRNTAHHLPDIPFDTG